MLLCVAGAFVLSSPQTERITRVNYERICTGMNRAEVEGILGPPGDYTIWPWDYKARPALEPEPTSTAEDLDIWARDGATIDVGYDSSGKVLFKSYGVTERRKQTVLEDLRCWAEYQRLRLLP
jgi:hypothetical protein